MASSTEIWISSLSASAFLAVVGVLPLVIIPFHHRLDSDPKITRILRVLVGFACGGLLGDVFLHLLPEAREKLYATRGRLEADTLLGLSTISGIMFFLFLEKAMSMLESEEEKRQNAKRRRKKKNGIDIVGILNLVVNALDNITHGLAIAAAFCSSFKTGVLTTFTMLIHELPHEVGDFAILLKSGFSKSRAIQLQFATSLAGIFGTLLGLLFEGFGGSSVFLLPFTAGGFIYIALRSLVPDMLDESKGFETPLAHDVTSKSEQVVRSDSKNSMSPSKNNINFSPSKNSNVSPSKSGSFTQSSPIDSFNCSCGCTDDSSSTPCLHSPSNISNHEVRLGTRRSSPHVSSEPSRTSHSGSMEENPHNPNRKASSERHESLLIELMDAAYIAGGIALVALVAHFDYHEE